LAPRAPSAAGARFELSAEALTGAGSVLLTTLKR
jgi:hypothetical protein